MNAKLVVIASGSTATFRQIVDATSHVLLRVIMFLAVKFTIHLFNSALQLFRERLSRLLYVFILFSLVFLFPVTRTFPLFWDLLNSRRQLMYG